MLFRSQVMDVTTYNNFVYLMGQYEQTVNQVNAFKAAGESGVASMVENNWYNNITQAALEPGASKVAYFMTGVLRGLPTKN